MLQTQMPRLRPSLIALAVLTVVVVVGMKLEGRIWWCACGSWKPVIFSAWSSHTSQHLLDPYTPSHISHGLLLGPILALVWMGINRYRTPARAGTSKPLDQMLAHLGSVTGRFITVLTIEVIWELLENSPFIINRYRAATASLDYSGDSIINSIGDLLSCALGFLIAQRFGVKWALVIFVLFELLILWTSRDNLTLNVIMLIYPIDAIKTWQTGG